MLQLWMPWCYRHQAINSRKNESISKIPEQFGKKIIGFDQNHMLKINFEDKKM